MINRFRIGTRKSVMALAQTNEIARRLTAAAPDLEVEVVTLDTAGDIDQINKLLPHGGKGGAFVAQSAMLSLQASCRRQCIRSRTCQGTRKRLHS